MIQTQGLEGNESEWIAFLERRGGGIQHTLEWKKAVEESYANCVPAYYMIREDGGVKALFPSFLVKSPLLGNRIISQPFVDNGGFAGQPTEGIAKALLEAIQRDYSPKRIEIRLNTSMPNYSASGKSLLAAGFSKESRRHQFILELKRAEELWNGFDKHVRNDVRKAEKSGLEIREISAGSELDSFYSLYSRAMHDFGTPQHSRAFFENLWKHLAPKKMIKGLNCYAGGDGNRLAASIIGYCFNKRVYIIYNVSSPEHRAARPNDLLYWNFIEWSARNGFKTFDLGQAEAGAQPGSRAHGIFKFKEKWGGKLFERPYFTYPPRSAGAAGKLRLFSGIWRLLPAVLAHKTGPWLCSQLGA